MKGAVSEDLIHSSLQEVANYSQRVEAPVQDRSRPLQLAEVALVCAHVTERLSVTKEMSGMQKRSFAQGIMDRVIDLAVYYAWLTEEQARDLKLQRTSLGKVGVDALMDAFINVSKHPQFIQMVDDGISRVARCCSAK